jgi:hypothetical protein
MSPRRKTTVQHRVGTSMPRIFRAIGDEFNHRFSRKDTIPVNQYEGFTSTPRHLSASLQGERAELNRLRKTTRDKGPTALSAEIDALRAALAHQH